MTETNEGMTFKEALDILGIADYGEAIFNSNSHGELLHLYDYVHLAEILRDADVKEGMFREWFLGVVKYANENWKRPESIYQYILDMFIKSAGVLIEDAES